MGLLRSNIPSLETTGYAVFDLHRIENNRILNSSRISNEKLYSIVSMYKFDSVYIHFSLTSFKKRIYLSYKIKEIYMVNTSYNRYLINADKAMICEQKMLC